MSYMRLAFAAYLICALSLQLYIPLPVNAQALIATTSVRVSICGDQIVNPGEECDVPTASSSNAYSTSIAGRNCNSLCEFAPYCGDAILQTLFGEQCDDGNNADGDFCAADCTIEPAATGGGNSSGGGGGGGGSPDDLGETQISIEGEGYPNRTINILLDGDPVGTVRTNSRGEFSFSTAADPGATTIGFWATDNSGVRSVTLSTTFDVTQGAITNVNGVLLPPTISVSDQTIDPGDQVTVRGQAIPNATVQVFVDNAIFTTVTAANDGVWSATLDTSSLSLAEHIIKARYVKGSSTLRTESSFSTALQLFVGVDGQPSNNSDLNRDGFVNLIDFSILIFWWQTNGGSSDPPADINQNGNVGLEDFSILLFNWTG